MDRIVFRLVRFWADLVGMGLFFGWVLRFWMDFILDEFCWLGMGLDGLGWLLLV